MAWRIPWTEDPSRLQESDTTERCLSLFLLSGWREPLRIPFGKVKVLSNKILHLHFTIYIYLIQNAKLFILFFYFAILHWFCHTSTWIRHRYTRAPHPDPSSPLSPCTIPLGRPSAPASSIQYRASNLDWRLVSYMILYMFQCHAPKSSHPLPLPQSLMRWMKLIFVLREVGWYEIGESCEKLCLPCFIRNLMRRGKEPG